MVPDVPVGGPDSNIYSHRDHLGADPDIYSHRDHLGADSENHIGMWLSQQAAGFWIPGCFEKELQMGLHPVHYPEVLRKLMEAILDRWSKQPNKAPYLLVEHILF